MTKTERGLTEGVKANNQDNQHRAGHTSDTSTPSPYQTRDCDVLMEDEVPESDSGYKMAQSDRPWHQSGHVRQNTNLTLGPSTMGSPGQNKTNLGEQKFLEQENDRLEVKDAGWTSSATAADQRDAAGASTPNHEPQNGPSLGSGDGDLQELQHPQNSQSYPFLLPDGRLQLSRGEILTQDYTIIQPDGRSSLADARIMLQLRDNDRVTGFELPPDPDPIYDLPRQDYDESDAECQICFDRVAKGDYSVIDCENSCLYCNECLNRMFLVSLTTRALYPPRCSCRKRIDIHSMLDMYTEDVHNLLMALPEEWQTQNPTYCGQEGCGAYIPEEQFNSSDGTELQVGACKVCEEMTCSRCKQTQAAHNNLCDKCPRKTVSPELYSFVKENQLTSCPNCKILVELEDGCSSVM
jgi:hypothetical protein